MTGHISCLYNVKHCSKLDEDLGDMHGVPTSIKHTQKSDDLKIVFLNDFLFSICDTTASYEESGNP